MRLIVGLKYADAVDLAEAAEEAAPPPQRDGPCFYTSIREICRIHASSDRAAFVLGLGFSLDIGIGDALGFGEDVGFGVVVFWISRVSQGGTA